MSEQRNLEKEINTLAKEFDRLRPYLRIAEAVEGLASCSAPLVEPATLLAGDKGMIVILLNHDRQQSWPQNEMFLKDSFFLEPVRWPFSVNVKLPKSLPIVEVLEISGNQCLSIPFKQIENLVTFDVPSLRATRQYILRSDKQPPHNKTDSPEYPISRHNGPKATFLEKQVFLGRVNPSPDGYQAVFFCRNDGNRLLHVEYVSDENTDVSLTPTQVVIKPKDTASLTAHCTADSNPTLHEVIHVKTNDLRRPLIRLDIGAEIVPDVEISPQTLTLDSTKGKMRGGSFVLSDKTGGGLEIKKIWSLDPRLSFAYGEHYKIAANNAMDVYKRNEIMHWYKVKVEPNFNSIETSFETEVFIETNSQTPQYRKISIPTKLDITTHIIRVIPKSLFFYSKGDNVTKKVRFVSEDAAFEVISIATEHENLLTYAQGMGNKKRYEFFVTFKPTENKGKFQGEISIVINYKGREYSIQVPYFVLHQ